MSAGPPRFTPRSVLVAGPLPPPMGGIAAFVDSMKSYAFGSDVHLHFVNTAKAPSSRSSPVRHALAAMQATLRVVGASSRIRPEVLHVHTSSHSAFYEKAVLVWGAKFLSIKTILHLHGGEFPRFYASASSERRKFIRATLRACSRVVVLSHHWVDLLSEEMGVPRERVVVIANGVAAPPRPEVGVRAHGPLRVLFLGVVDEHKGIRDLFEAVRLLKGRDCEIALRIAGPIARDEAYRSSLLAQVEAAGLIRNVEWLGAKMGAEKWGCLAEADIFVIPSHVEAMPLVLLEAMAMARPIVATAVGAIPEVVEDGRQALLVPARDAEALAAAVQRLAEDPGLRAGIGDAAFTRFQDAFQFGIAATKLKQLYLEV